MKICFKQNKIYLDNYFSPIGHNFDLKDQPNSDIAGSLEDIGIHQFLKSKISVSIIVISASETLFQHCVLPIAGTLMWWAECSFCWSS